MLSSAAWLPYNGKQETVDGSPRGRGHPPWTRVMDAYQPGQWHDFFVFTISPVWTILLGNGAHTPSLLPRMGNWEAAHNPSGTASGSMQTWIFNPSSMAASTQTN